MKFTIIKYCLARFSGIFALGTPSNIHGTAISYRCAKFSAFVNSVTILTLRDLTTFQTSCYEAGGGGVGGKETRSGTKKQCSHNLQSGHPAWWSADKCTFSHSHSKYFWTF